MGMARRRRSADAHPAAPPDRHQPACARRTGSCSPCRPTPVEWLYHDLQARRRRRRARRRLRRPAPGPRRGRRRRARRQRDLKQQRTARAPTTARDATPCHDRPRPRQPATPPGGAHTAVATAADRRPAGHTEGGGNCAGHVGARHWPSASPPHGAGGVRQRRQDDQLDRAGHDGRRGDHGRGGHDRPRAADDHRRHAATTTDARRARRAGSAATTAGSTSRPPTSA